MLFHAITGIVLKIQPYSDQAQIAKIFSREAGIVAVYATKTAAKGGGLSSFNKVELLVRATKGELLRVKEIKHLYGYLGLRASYAALRAAGEMAQVLLEFLDEGEPLPQLFDLFADYLLRMERGLPPHALLASFYFKFLRLEGLWSENRPSDSRFDPQEWEICRGLAHCRTTEELQSLPVDELFLEKVKELFLRRF